MSYTCTVKQWYVVTCFIRVIWVLTTELIIRIRHFRANDEGLMLKMSALILLTMAN